MEGDINTTGSWCLLVVVCFDYDKNSRSGGVAAVSNDSFLVCKPYIHYRTFVCTTELTRRAANYSETAVGDLTGRFEFWFILFRDQFITHIGASNDFIRQVWRRTHCHIDCQSLLKGSSWQLQVKALLCRHWCRATDQSSNWIHFALAWKACWYSRWKSIKRFTQGQKNFRRCFWWSAPHPSWCSGWSQNGRSRHQSSCWFGVISQERYCRNWKCCSCIQN